MNGFPGHSYGDGRLRQDFTDKTLCLREQVRRFHDPVNEPDLERLVCCDESSRQKKFCRASFSDQSGKSCGTSKTSNRPDTNLRMS